jgi:hypothetical protein
MAQTKYRGGQLGNEFTGAAALTQSSGTVNIDWATSQIFNFTATQNITLNMQSVITGITKLIVITGEGQSNTIAFNVGGNAGTFNHLGGDYVDTAGTKNLVQVTAVDSTEFWYTISQIQT